MGNESSTEGTWNCPIPHPRRGETSRIPQHFLLIGRTGDGKSATGNFILGEKVFATSGGTSSKTKEVKVNWAHYDRYEIKVIDGPGLKDTDLSTADDKKRAVKLMIEALLQCNGGVHVFLLVMKLGFKFTDEMKQSISHLKMIFGEDYLKKRGIIVVTHGDEFDRMKERGETKGQAFDEWVRDEDQDEDFKKLISECNSRILLFDNVTVDEQRKQEQKKALFSLAEELEKAGAYTSNHFQVYKIIREKLEKQNGPLLKEDLQKQVALLRGMVDGFLQNPNLRNVELLQSGIKRFILAVNTQQAADVKVSLQNVKEYLMKMDAQVDVLKGAVEGNSVPNAQSHADQLKDLIEGLIKVTKISLIKSFTNFLASIGRSIASLLGARSQESDMASTMSTIARIFKQR